MPELPSFWPNREYSRFLRVDGVDWHVQTRGTGPALLLIHGTGASSHTWAALSDALADRFTLIMPDLPGQGFSSALPERDISLDGFSRHLKGLLDSLGVRPKLLVGHSAGAVIATQMTLHCQFAPAAIVSLNGAFLPFGSAAAPLFNRLAKWLSKSTLLAYITAAHGMFNRPVRNMLVETGSVPSAEMMRCYRELISRPNHIMGTLKMMAGWDLEEQRQLLPSLRTPLHLVTCSNDRTVSPWQSERLSEFIACSQLYSVPNLGHLGHEEDPGPFTDIIASTL